MNDEESTLSLKYRPRSIEKMVGQEPAKLLLRGIFTPKSNGKFAIPRSILVTGPWGTGKTTTAKLIARYLNCIDKGPGEVCGECRSCRMLAKDDPHPDVVEINCVADGGKDQIRKLIEDEKLNPQHRHKVFILDEAHGLTGQAASTFLIPYEKPSPKTVFILCTTNPEKLLNTLVSRSLHIRLSLIDKEPMVAHLRKIAKKEGFKLPEDSAGQIADMAQGHARDALMMLQAVQMHVAGGGKGIDTKNLASIVDKVVQASPVALSWPYMQSLLSGDYQAAAIAGQVTAHEFFLKLAVQFTKNLIFQLRAPKRMDANFRGHTLTYKRSFDAEQLTDLLGVLVRNLRDLKSYLVDPADALDLATFEALKLTRTWEKAESSKKELPTGKFSEGSALARVTKA